MVTPELTQYVQAQLASGISVPDIRSALASTGWVDSDIDQVVSRTPQEVLPEPEPQVAPKKRGRLILSSILLIALLAGGGAYEIFAYGQKPSTVTSISTPSANPLKTFKDTGIQFKYDGTWKKIGSSALVTGKLDDSALAPSSIPENQYLFFTPTNWTATKKEVVDFQSAPSSGSDTFGAVFGLIAKIGYQSDFSLTRVPSTTAQSAARQITQTVCTGTNSDFSTTNPVVESRVQSTTIGKYKAYLVLPQVGCTYKVTQVFFDAASTANTSDLNSSHDSFILSFGNSIDLQHLSQAQQMLLYNVKLL